MADDISGDNKVTNVLDDDDKRCRDNDEDGVQVKFRGVESRQSEPRRGHDRRPVNQTGDCRDDITADDTNENRQNGKQAPKGDGAGDSDKQRGNRNYNRCGIRVIGGQSGHTGCRWHKFQPYDSDDGAHGGRRKERVDPLRSD